MLRTAFPNSLRTVASVQYSSSNTKLQLIILVNRKILKKNSVYIQKDSGSFHVRLSSQLRKEMKLNHSLCTGTPHSCSELLNTRYLKDQVCETFRAKPFVLHTRFRILFWWLHMKSDTCTFRQFLTSYSQTHQLCVSNTCFPP